MGLVKLPASILAGVFGEMSTSTEDTPVGSTFASTKLMGLGIYPASILAGVFGVCQQQQRILWSVVVPGCCIYMGGYLVNRLYFPLPC